MNELLFFAGILVAVVGVLMFAISFTQRRVADESDNQELKIRSD